MKKLLFIIGVGLVGTSSIFAQQSREITADNSWLKAGVTVAVPVGDADDLSSISAGLDLRGQYLVTPNFAIGVATGYNHFFGKDNVSDFGVIPAAGFARYYFQPKGLFIGTDVGYGFLTNIDGNDGGLYVNPQIGYHNRNINLYAFYQNTFAENDFDVQAVGVGLTYNIRFN